MPIYLPPISRRQFLARSLAAGAGLALAPKLLAETKPCDPHSWALLSDIHIAADSQLAVRGSNMSDHLTSVVGELGALPERPAGIFVNGDCAHSLGQKEDYAQVTRLLEPVRKNQIPVHLALGNHDNRERFWEALQDEGAAKRPVKDRQTALLRGERANWFVLDSLEKTAVTPGLLGKEQLAWLAEALDANADKPALVLVHHNPGIEENFGLKDSVALFEVIRPRKQVKAYIYGHTHTWKTDQDTTGLHLINLPSVAYVFQAGNPTGWVHARLADDGMRLELRCLDKAHKLHGQTLNLKWRTG